MLNSYLQQTQRFLRDTNQQMLNPEDLISYINRARREVAMRSQSVRILTPISGSIITIEVDNTDSDNLYSDTPTITITTPDFPAGSGPYPEGLQATASAVVNNGVIEQITVENGGYGYYQPTVTITDSTGSGATATVTELTYINQLEQGKEVYNFSDVDLSMFPGVESIYMVRSISILFSQFRYSLAIYSMSVYQSKIRSWSQQWQYVPACGAQFGQGVSGSMFFYPIASQSYQCEWDCACLPSDLIDNNSVEAIPAPWTEAVPYWAASMAYEELQNLNASSYYFKKFDTLIQRFSDYSRVGRAVNPYGRYAAPFILGATGLLQYLADGVL